jgi:hypothetical protein
MIHNLEDAGASVDVCCCEQCLSGGYCLIYIISLVRFREETGNNGTADLMPQ